MGVAASEDCRSDASPLDHPPPERREVFGQFQSLFADFQRRDAYPVTEYPRQPVELRPVVLILFSFSLQLGWCRLTQSVEAL
jgi:hypothetical protein